MFGTRLFQLMLLALVLAYVADAVSPAVMNDALKVRQDDNNDDEDTNLIDLPTILPGTTDPAEDTSSTEAAPTESSTQPVESTTTTSTTEEPTSESTAPASTTTDPLPEETSTSQQPESTTTSSPPSDPDTSTTEQGESSTTTTTNEPATTSSEGEQEEEEQQTTTTREPVTSTSWETITRTNSAGELETTTSASVSTITPGLSEGDGDDSGGLSTGTRNIVIGVVVGVGGAIILGALAIVAWRIRARKKLAEENDALMEYTGGYTPVDKSEPPAPGSSPSTAPTGSARSPFQSTLDTYHQPSQPVNASSNF